MLITFTGKNIDVTPALKLFTEEKFTKLMRHSDEISAINITFNVEKLEQMAEATMIACNTELYAHASSDNMYTSIDELIAKLDRQLIKHKEKARTHQS
jgi:putative sigma-54 modulation protein